MAFSCSVFNGPARVDSVDENDSTGDTICDMLYILLPDQYACKCKSHKVLSYVERSRLLSVERFIISGAIILFVFTTQCPANVAHNPAEPV